MLSRGEIFDRCNFIVHLSFSRLLFLIVLLSLVNTVRIQGMQRSTACGIKTTCCPTDTGREELAKCSHLSKGKQ
jgi:hypothetical protein